MCAVVADIGCATDDDGTPRLHNREEIQSNGLWKCCPNFIWYICLFVINTYTTLSFFFFLSLYCIGIDCISKDMVYTTWINTIIHIE